jgi:hypothetical protein
MQVYEIMVVYLNLIMLICLLKFHYVFIRGVQYSSTC